MTKDVMKPRNIPMDLHRGSSWEVASGVGQQAVEVESVSQQASDAAGAGAQHVDSTSWINLISFTMIFPSIIFDL
jgi:hypothetical protein